MFSGLKFDFSPHTKEETMEGRRAVSFGVGICIVARRSAGWTEVIDDVLARFRNVFICPQTGYKVTARFRP